MDVFSRWWFHIFWEFSPRFVGKWFIQFDGSHIFQMGWFNHQLVLKFEVYYLTQILVELLEKALSKNLGCDHRVDCRWGLGSTGPPCKNLRLVQMILGDHILSSHMFTLVFLFSYVTLSSCMENVTCFSSET